MESSLRMHQGLLLTQMLLKLRYRKTDHSVNFFVAMGFLTLQLLIFTVFLVPPTNIKGLEKSGDSTASKAEAVADQDSKDKALLRKVLYDVVILGEYSFLDIDREILPTFNCMKQLALRRLILIHEATQKARENKDHAKAISYMNAFSKSYLPSW